VHQGRRGSTLKTVRLTQLQACPKKCKEIVPELSEQATYLCLQKITGIQPICAFGHLKVMSGSVQLPLPHQQHRDLTADLWWGLAV
jgi:hypothetical protein